LRCQSKEPSLAARDEDHGEEGYPSAAHGRDPAPEQMDARRKL